MRIATLALFAASLAVLPLSTAKAQYYYCDPFPLAWPFCIAGAAVGTAATIATAPFYYPYYHPYYARPYYYHRSYYHPARKYNKKRRYHSRH